MSVSLFLLCMQQEEWSAADDTFKVHKSKLELAKEQAAAAKYIQTLCVLQYN